MNQPGRNANRLGPGRPCLDDQRQKTVCDLMARGLSMHSVAAAVGVNDKTIYRHAKRDPKFADAMAQARARGEFRLVQNLHEAAFERNQWRAAAWLLKHCYRKHYATPRNGIPPEQVRDICSRLFRAVLREVSSPADRKRIAARLRQLNGPIAGAARVDLRIGHES